MHGVEIRRTDVTGRERAVRALVREYYAFADRLAIQRFPNRLSGIDVEAAADDDIERLRSAAVPRPVVLAVANDRAVGLVQLKRLDAVTAEVKRLYVGPGHRSEGVGRRLMERVLEAAEAEGFETLRLGVGPYLEQARALYQDLGFEETPPYEETNCPPSIHEEWHFMRLDLGDR